MTLALGNLIQLQKKPKWVPKAHYSMELEPGYNFKCGMAPGQPYHFFHNRSLIYAYEQFCEEKYASRPITIKLDKQYYETKIDAGQSVFFCLDNFVWHLYRHSSGNIDVIGYPKPRNANRDFGNFQAIEFDFPLTAGISKNVFNGNLTITPMKVEINDAGYLVTDIKVTFPKQDAITLNFKNNQPFSAIKFPYPDKSTYHISHLLSWVRDAKRIRHKAKVPNRL